MKWGSENTGKTDFQLKDIFTFLFDLELVACNQVVHNNTARQATLPHGSFWQAKLTTSDDLGNFSTHVTTFHHLCTTLTTNGDDILMTLKTNAKTL